MLRAGEKAFFLKKVSPPHKKHQLTKKGEPPTRVLPLSLLRKEIHPLLRLTNDIRGYSPLYPRHLPKKVDENFSTLVCANIALSTVERTMYAKTLPSVKFLALPFFKKVAKKSLTQTTYFILLQGTESCSERLQAVIIEFISDRDSTVNI